MAHRMQAEFAEGDALHLAVGGMVFDPVLVAAEAVAGMQHRRMLVGGVGQFVEAAAGEVPGRAVVERQQRVSAQPHRRPAAAAAGLEVVQAAGPQRP